jgi:multiple sugar transport system permease protein
VQKVKQKSYQKVVIYLLFAAIVCICIFPLFWQLIASLKFENQIFTRNITFIPKPLTWGNYIKVFTTEGNFLCYISNSVAVSVIVTAICLLISSLAAYALGRLNFHGKYVIFCIFLIGAMFPQIAIITPLFLFFKSLHVLDSYLSLIIPYTAFNIPITVWVLSEYFKEIPAEIDDAAKIDGCTYLQVFSKIMVPLVAPGLVATGLLILIACWNEFIFSLTFIRSDQLRTVPVAIALFPGVHNNLPWGQISAASFSVTLPIILVVLIFQKRIISGLTAGAVKA